MHNVMVLDDDSNVGLLIQHLLEPEGFSVSAARMSSEFGRTKEISPADVYVLDITLPDGYGLDLLREIRGRSSSGIILLSAHDSETCRVAGLELGADDFIAKPFRPRELAARIKAVCRRTTARREQGMTARPGGAIKIGDYILLSAGRSVLTAEGTEVALTTAEFNVFSVLAHRQGEVLTRDEIIGLSKGRDWRCYDRSVDGLISRLRRKLPSPPGTPHFIKTVHGTGYTIAKTEVSAQLGLSEACLLCEHCPKVAFPTPASRG